MESIGSYFLAKILVPAVVAGVVSVSVRYFFVRYARRVEWNRQEINRLIDLALDLDEHAREYWLSQNAGAKTKADEVKLAVLCERVTRLLEVVGERKSSKIKIDATAQAVRIRDLVTGGDFQTVRRKPSLERATDVSHEITGLISILMLANY